MQGSDILQDPPQKLQDFFSFFLAKRLAAGKKEKKSPAPGQVDYAAAAQKELSSALGRKVRIVTGRNKGRIELEYYGIDDLNDLLEALALLRNQRKGQTP